LGLFEYWSSTTSHCAFSTLDAPKILEFGTRNIDVRALLSPEKLNAYRDVTASGGQLSMF
jgi:hypothetical protein